MDGGERRVRVCVGGWFFIGVVKEGFFEGVIFKLRLE